MEAFSLVEETSLTPEKGVHFFFSKYDLKVFERNTIMKVEEVTLKSDD